MPDKSVYIGETLKGWIAWCVNTDQSSYAAASDPTNFVRNSGVLDIVTYRSDEYNWEDLPKFGILCIKKFTLDAQSNTKPPEVHNGYNQYCPYNEVSDLADITNHIKWGIMLDNSQEFDDVYFTAKNDTAVVLTMLD